MEIKANVKGSVLSLVDGVKVLGVDGNVHFYKSLLPKSHLKLGNQVSIGDTIGKLSDHNKMHYEVNKYEDEKVGVNRGIRIHSNVGTKEKFTVDVCLNHFVLNILDKYKLKITPSINIDNIIVDYRRPEASKNTIIDICLLGTSMNGKQTYTAFLSLSDFSFDELAELIATMINLYKPKEIKLDTCGMGRGVKDALEVELKKIDIEYGDQGLLIYKAKQVKLAERERVKQEIQDLLDKANHLLNTVSINSSSADIYQGHIHGVIVTAKLFGFKIEPKNLGNGYIVN